MIRRAYRDGAGMCGIRLRRSGPILNRTAVRWQAANSVQLQEGNPMAMDTTQADADPEGQRLPIKLDSTSNGEFVPIALDASLQRANALAHEWAGGFAKRLNQSR